MRQHATGCRQSLRSYGLIWLLVSVEVAALHAARAADEPRPAATPDAATIRGKVMCGYQGWFRCPGDGSNQGWIHWSRDRQRIAPDTLSFEMWPDMLDYGPGERYPAPGFSFPDGSPAVLFSSANAQTVLRHFTWMRDYGIDGAWLQHFVVDLPGGPAQDRYASRRTVIDHVAAAARQTERVWALSYDISGMPGDRLVQVLSDDWRKLVDAKVVERPGYLHERELPVVQVWGFYRNNPGIALTAADARRICEFFQAPGPYRAYLVGGGDWAWRSTTDEPWSAIYRRFDAYIPWNVGNYATDSAGVRHATTSYWADDRRECECAGVYWIPSIYPGFGWDNLKRQPAGSTQIARRGGQFYWEQFHELAQAGVDTAFLAMFDEVDEGTAIFKVTNQPPTQARFVDYEGLPSDWYLRLSGEGARMLRKQRPTVAGIPLRP